MAKKEPPRQVDGCPHVEVVKAGDVLKEIDQVNDELAAIFRRLRHPPAQTLFVANYPYGALPVDRGVFRPPCSGPLCGDCQRLINWVGSNWPNPRTSLPLQLILSGWAEAHLDHDSDSVPLRLLQKGEFFGAFELCDTLAGMEVGPPPWSVSSGARSLVIQASLGDRRVRRALAEALHQSEMTLPDPIAHPWKFARLIASRNTTCHSRIFFIPSEWIFAENETSRQLCLYVALTSWRQSAFLRLNVADDTVELPDQKLLVPYHTARHLLLVARGEAPAFRLVKKEEPAELEAAPFKQLRQVVEGALSEVKMQHVPLFLQPHHLTTRGASGYYSLSRPTLLGPRLPTHRNHAGWLAEIWNGLQTIHGDRHSDLDLKSTTAHAPFETSKPPGHRMRAGLGLETYLRNDLGLPDKDPDKPMSSGEVHRSARRDPGGPDEAPDKPASEFRLRNSKGERSFFAACIRVVRS